MTAEELDAWRWTIALSVAEAPRVSGFDPKKMELAHAWLQLVVLEYRRLVIADERPAVIGKASPYQQGGDRSLIRVLMPQGQWIVWNWDTASWDDKSPAEMDAMAPLAIGNAGV